MKTLALVAVCLCAAAFAQQSDYQISGIVVDHVTNRPLNHVLVEITTVGGTGGDASVVTESDGRFTFLQVPRGKYNLQAQKRGQFPQGFHATEGGYATAIVVDGLLKTTDLVFPLRTDSFITGLVMGDDGEPIRDAQVALFRDSVQDGEAHTMQVGTVVTKSSGQFHFGHLEAGKYYLAASGTPWYSQPGTETVYPVTFYGDTTDGRAAKPVVLAEGGSANIRIDLHAVPGIRVKLPHGQQNLLLSVAGPGGTLIPIPASIISAGGQGQMLFHNAAGSSVGPSSEQAEEGVTSELFNLPAGRYQVSSFDGQYSQQMQTVDLTNGATLTFDANSSPSQVTGRIIFDTPRPQEEIELFLTSGQRGIMASIAPDGKFKFEKTSAGKFDLNLNSATLAISSLEAKGATLIHDHLEIPSGADVELTIHVQTVDSMAKLQGIAVQGEIGVAGAMVLLLPRDLARTRQIRRDQSDADGSFSLASILPGSYTLLAIDDGHDLAYKDEKVIKPYLENGLPITIPLKSSETLKITVQTRKP